MSRHSVIRRTLRSSASASLVALSLGLSASAFAQDAKPMAAPSDAAQAAFKRADANGDGKLSKEEAARLPGIAEKFDALDKEGKGFLTMADFAAGFDTKK
jgi:Ca2+-binding EF-hand superfamily protein